MPFTPSCIAIVTGAGSGIGRAIAQAFSKAGTLVVAADRNKAAAEDTVKLLNATARRALAVEVDVADRRSAGEMISAATGAFGPEAKLKVGADSKGCVGVWMAAWQRTVA
jgi:NAD(P)-dependent dehydrogenase (short-subunit alcohol dehydrogenase family)